MSRYRIGIDVGGTFTDFVLIDLDTGVIQTKKVPTTPADPSEGVLHGITELGVALDDLEDVSHGTTTATNALIERDGARTAFLTTEGFRDTLEIRRTNRQELYDGQWFPPPPLVPRRNRIEITERLMWDGEAAVPLDEAQVEDVIETLRARDIEAVAICFLHSYQHPAHETRVKQLVEKALPDVFVTASSDVSQEFREFERGSTVAANAYLGPKVQGYMRNLNTRLREAGYASDVAIMQSNGGVCTTEEAATLPVKLARSGPAGGAMALERVAELTGIDNLVGIDIGGTSADVSVIVDGRSRWTSPLVVEWGMPLLFPSVDVESIGAGGGSIAWIDQANVLHMGPQSAGADPGPACYDRGGTDATSTDAHVVLGRVATDRFLDGSMQMRPELAEEAIRSNVAEPLGLDVHEAAEGMLRILDSNMLQAVRYVTIEKGYDPRDFALVGLGGGGPLHVATLAKELGVSKAIVPVNPGVLSAWGMLTVDMVQDRSRTILKRRYALDTDELAATLTELRGSIEEAFLRAGVAADEIDYEYFLDLQYYGQVFSLAVGLGGVELDELPPDDESGDGVFRPSEEGALSVQLPVDDGAQLTVTEDHLERATETFHQEHEREYGHSDREQEVQVVHARVFGHHKVTKPEALAEQRVGPSPSDAQIGTRTVRFDSVEHETPVYDRLLLQAGNVIDGPAMIDELSSTTALPPGTTAEVDEYGNLLLTVS